MSSSSHSSSTEYYSFPRSVRWIDTFLWEGLGDLRNPGAGGRSISYIKPLNSINTVLCFVLLRSHPDILTLCCIRSHTGHEPLDDNCYIKLYISLCNFDERERSGVLSLDRSTIFLDYDLQSYRPPDCQHDETFMKCLVRVIEMEDTSNSERERQEQELFRMAREVFASPDQLIEMAYVLRRPYFGNVYTGRMDPSSASLMSALIANACQYSRYIYDYITARDRSEPRMPNIPLTEILSGICHPQRFNEYICSLLFTVAHRYGLEFLRVLCSTYLIENLNGNNMLSTICLGYWTGESELFQAGVEYLIGRHSLIVPRGQWALEAQSAELWVQNILRRLRYPSTTEDWSFPPLPEYDVVDEFQDIFQF